MYTITHKNTLPTQNKNIQNNSAKEYVAHIQFNTNCNISPVLVCALSGLTLQYSALKSYHVFMYLVCI